MKIFYITNARIPTEKAHGYQIGKMCEELARAGAEIKLVVPTRKQNKPEDAFDYYGLERNFDLQYLRCPDFLLWDRFLMGKSIYLNSLLFFFRVMFRRPDQETVIFTRSPEIAWLFSGCGRRVFFEAHSWPNSKKRLFNFFLKKTKIIAISQGLKEVIVANGFPAENILVAPDGVDLEKFDNGLSRSEAREKLGWPANVQIILYTGHLYRWKGADVLAQAANLLPLGRAVYFIGGTDRDRNDFCDKYRDLIRAGKIVTVPMQARKMIPIFLKAADFLVLPNTAKEIISRQFTSPLKLFEYLASERPIIASDLPSLREILNEKNCLFFQPDNPADLAEKISRLAADQNLADRLAAQARQDAKQYDWSKRAEKILAFIKAA